MSDNSLPNRILLLAANPKGTDKLRLEEEARDIKEGLRQARERDQFTIESEWAVRPRDIRRAILYFRPQIVHFSGHGSEDGGLAFENESGQIQLVKPDALSELFRLLSSHVKCVILNACYSEIQATAIAQHIEIVIGMNERIGDQAAIEFAVGFYDALGAGYSAGIAYEFGCNAIQIAGLREHSTPILRRKSDTTSSVNMAPSNSESSTPATKPILQSLNTRSASSVASKITYEFVLTGNIDEINKKKIEAIFNHLQEVTGDTSLTLLKIESGSVKLILEGSEEGFQKLAALIESGELSQISEVPVLEVSRSYKSEATTHILEPEDQAASNSNERKRLGTYLVEAGLMTDEQVHVILRDQEVTGMRFGEIAVARGWLKEATIEWIMKKIVIPERKRLEQLKKEEELLEQFQQVNPRQKISGQKKNSSQSKPSSSHLANEPGKNETTSITTNKSWPESKSS